MHVYTVSSSTHHIIKPHDLMLVPSCWKVKMCRNNSVSSTCNLEMTYENSNGMLTSVVSHLSEEVKYFYIKKVSQGLSGPFWIMPHHFPDPSLPVTSWAAGTFPDHISSPSSLPPISPVFHSANHANHLYLTPLYNGLCLIPSKPDCHLTWDPIVCLPASQPCLFMTSWCYLTPSKPDCLLPLTLSTLPGHPQSPFLVTPVTHSLVWSVAQKFG